MRLTARRPEQIADEDRRYAARDRKRGVKDPAYQIITRAIWCRGERQRLALEHLRERGLWLTKAQKRAAGIAE